MICNRKWVCVLKEKSGAHAAKDPKKFRVAEWPSGNTGKQRIQALQSRSFEEADEVGCATHLKHTHPHTHTLTPQ